MHEPKIELLNMDCLLYMKQCEDKQFDLAIVDPPYGINIAEWDKVDCRPSKTYWNELFRISKNQIVWGGNYFVDNLPITKGWCVWDKTIRGKSYLGNRSDFELIWSSFNKTTKIFNYTLDGNIEGWDGGRPNYKKQKSIHPTQKPKEVYKFLLKYFAESGNKIIDTHLGSGSIAIACYDLKFDLVGIEIDSEYFQKASKRLELHKKQLTLF